MSRPAGKPLPESHRRNIQRAVLTNWNKRRNVVGKFPEPSDLALDRVRIAKSNETGLAAYLIDQKLSQLKETK